MKEGSGAGSGSVLVRVRLLEAQKHTDPDPHHWLYIFREDSGDVAKNTCSLCLQTPQKLPPQLYGRFPVQVLCQTRGNKQEIGPGIQP
jgi:hypothetical protein